MTQWQDVKFEYGSTTLMLRLDDRKGEPFPFKEGRWDKFALQQWTGDSLETAQKAENIITITQKHFHGGMGQRNFEIPEKYFGIRGSSMGADTRTKGKVICGPLITAAATIDCNQLNPGFENWFDTSTPYNYTSGSTGGTVTLTRNTADKDTGTYCCQMVSDGTNDGFVRFTVPKPTAFRSKEITITMRVKTSTAARVRVIVRDNTADTAGSNHTGGGAYETLSSGAFTVNGAATSVSWDAYIGAGGAVTAYIDMITLTVTGGLTHAWSGTPIRFFENDSQLYLLTTEELCRWDNTNTKWLIILHTDTTGDSVFTDGIAFGNYVFVGCKDTAGALDEWWQATKTEVFSRQTQATCKASHFTASQGTFVAAVAANQIKTATSPWNTGGDPMSTATTVCDAGQSITALAPFYDAIMIGYTNGLSYLDSSGTLHAAVRLPGLASTNNFVNMFPWEGLGQKVLMCPIGVNSLYTYEGTYGKMENISPSVLAPQMKNFHGRIRSMATDGTFLYVFTEYDTTVGNGGKLLAYTYENVGSFTGYVLHPLSNPDTAPCCWVSGLQATNKRLWYVKEASSAINTIGYYILANTQDPTQDSACRYKTSSAIESSWIDAGTPGDNKVALYIDVQGSGLTANKYITVAYSLNGSDTTTSLGNCTSNGTTRFYFAVDVTFKEILFQFLCATNDTASTPVFEKASFACRNAAEATPSFWMRLKTQGQVMLRGGQQSNLLSTKATADAIRSMATYHYVKMTHYLDDPDAGTSHYITIMPPTPERNFGETRNESWFEIVGLRAPTS